MLIIDPNLHNPIINGMELIVNNRINPALAIAKEDLYAGSGIVIEKFQDGTIRISADIDDLCSGSGKYLNMYEIDFMNNLPSTLYKFLNTLFSGIGVNVFYANDYSVVRNTTEFKPSTMYTYGVDNSVGG